MLLHTVSERVFLYVWERVKKISEPSATNSLMFTETLLARQVDTERALVHTGQRCLKGRVNRYLK